MKNLSEKFTHFRYKEHPGDLFGWLDDDVMGTDDYRASIILNYWHIASRSFYNTLEILLKIYNSTIFK